MSTSSHEQALSVDAEVTLDELLDRHARETLVHGARDLGVALTVIDRDNRALVGEAPPPEVMAVPVDLDPVTANAKDGRRFVIGQLRHEGAAIGLLSLGPFGKSHDDGAAQRLGEHLLRMSEAFMYEGVRRAMSARIHMATVEEANRELTEKNKRLAQAVERLQEVDRIKSNFLATVSHELRTPLTSVIGYSEMLLEEIAGPLNDEQKVLRPHGHGKGRPALVAHQWRVLDISRMESGDMRFDRQPFALDEVASVALSTVAPLARKKRLQVSCSIPDDFPSLLGDRDKVRQVLLNLLGNAIKFTPEAGRIELSATIAPLARTSDKAPLGARILVKDSGIGVAPEHHARLFDPFYQVDNSSTREYGGTGLGLSIVRRFIEGQGGQVWLESQEGKGAAFYVTLPLVADT